MQKNMDIRPHTSRNIVAESSVKRPILGKGKRRKATVAGIVITLLVLAGAVWWYVSHTSSYFIQSNKYQVIVLNNNQIYFGKLQRLYDNSFRLTNVYYLQQKDTAQTDAAATPDDQTAATATPQLVKLGNELHGPEDAMVFDTTQVLYWENLKPDGKVSKSIEEYLKQ